MIIIIVKLLLTKTKAIAFVLFILIGLLYPEALKKLEKNLHAFFNLLKAEHENERCVRY
jgi:hypothetical protein